MYDITKPALIIAFWRGISALATGGPTSTDIDKSSVLHFVSTIGKIRPQSRTFVADFSRDIGNSKKNGNPETRMPAPKFHFSKNTGIWFK